jgi:hypothetical protein
MDGAKLLTIGGSATFKVHGALFSGFSDHDTGDGAKVYITDGATVDFNGARFHNLGHEGMTIDRTGDTTKFTNFNFVEFKNPGTISDPYVYLKITGEGWGDPGLDLKVSAGGVSIAFYYKDASGGTHASAHSVGFTDNNQWIRLASHLARATSLYSHASTFDYGHKDTSSGFDWGGTTYAEVVALTAEGFDEAVLVEWTTATEINNLGFNVYRAQSADGPWVRINPVLVLGLGSTFAGGEYYFADKLVDNGTRYFYMLEDVETTGRRKLHGPVSAVPSAEAGLLPELDDAKYASHGSTDDEPGGSQAAGDDPAAGTGGVTPPSEFVRQLDPVSWVISESDTGMVIEIRIPDYEKVPVFENGSECPDHSIRPSDALTRIDIPGFMHTTAVGLPALPTKGLLIPIPACERVRMAVLARKVRRVERIRDIYCVPGPGPDLSPEDDGAASRLRFGKRDDAARARISHNRRGGSAASGTSSPLPYWPRSVITSSGLIYHGARPLVLLTVNPARYKHSSGMLKSYSRVVVRLTFRGAPPEPEPPGDADETQEFVCSRDALKVRIKEAGVYRVTHADFAGAGFDMSFDPRNLMLVSRGSELPLFVSGESDGVLGPGDYAEFYAIGYDDEYAGENVYYITVADSAGMRMESASGGPSGGSEFGSYPATAHFEKNHAYMYCLHNPDVTDRWMWKACIGIPGTVRDADFAFDLDAVAPGGGPGVLEYEFQGYTTFPDVDDEHHAGLLMNGELLCEVTFDGHGIAAGSASIPAGALACGSNTLTVRMYGDGGAPVDIIFLNNFDVTYWRGFAAGSGSIRFSTPGAGTVRITGLYSAVERVYDVTDAGAPRVITDLTFADSELEFHAPCAGGFAVDAAPATPLFEFRPPSGLRSGTNRADYLLVTHGDFRNASELLAAHREAEGLAVLVADADAVYDEFNFGFESPDAIRSFFAYAQESYVQPSARFALIMGDASVDSKCHLGFRSNFVVTKFIRTVKAYVASENYLCAFRGSDDLPDISLGRLAVSTADESDAVVSKIIAYESALSGAWSKASIFVSDVPGCFDFETSGTGRLLPLVPAGGAVTHVKASEGGATERVLSSWNEGAAVVHYTGHGGACQWGYSIGRPIFHVTHARELINEGRLPFVLVANCASANFTMPLPQHECVAEDLLENPTGGAIAVFASTGLTTPYGQVEMNAEVLRLYYSGASLRAGELTDAGKTHLATLGAHYTEIIRTWTLIGDPATHLK